MIGALGGLDLHGTPHNVSWTRLATTASAGQTSITLSEPVDWAVGDEIVLTTTDTRIGHAERHTIGSISGGGTIIGLTNALAYTHIVINHVFPNGEMYHVAGAVGLLTRNVRIINRSPASEKFGFRIVVTDYATNVWNPVGAEYLYTYYKGFARLSHTQFIGFGQFVDAPNEDKREAIHLYNLGDWNMSRPTYVDSCSFDTGYYSAYVSLEKSLLILLHFCAFSELAYGRPTVFQLLIMSFIILMNQLSLPQERIILFKRILCQLCIGLVQLNLPMLNSIRIMTVLLCQKMPQV